MTTPPTTTPPTTPPPTPPTTTPPTAPTGRLLCADAVAADLPEELPAGEEVLAGTPSARYLQLPVASPAGVGVGVWEMTPGAARDTEAEEVFVVLSGRATVVFDDDEVLELAPGSVVHLREGDRTTWTVHEPLRKVYLQLP